MTHNAKGAATERSLVNELDDRGWAVVRIPSSGAATDRDLPDVLFGNGDRSYAVELKASSGDPIYLTGEEVDALCRFAEGFGAQPRIGVRFDIKRGDPAWGNDDDPGFYFFRHDEVHQTDGGNYRVKKEDIPEGETIADLWTRT